MELAPTMEATTSKKETFLNRFEQRPFAPANSAVVEAQAKAALALKGLEFPTRKTEKWKYSPVTKILNGSWVWQDVQSPASVDSFLIPDLDAHIFVFVNGAYQSKLSSWEAQDGVSIKVLSEGRESQVISDYYGKNAEIEEDIFSAINTAFSQDGLAIHVAKNVQVAKPVFILQLTSGGQALVQNRHLLVADQGAEVNVVQLFRSADGEVAFNNSLSEIFVGANAKVNWDKIQNESDANMQVAAEYVSQQQDSTFTINSLTPTGAWVRNSLYIRIKGQNCVTNLNGAYMPRDKQHVDNRTEVDHLVPHCESHELYKGIVYDKATAVFNGKVFVRPDAQLTNAFQQNANILMSDDATVNSKPELEIYADDVQCSHGSTIGQFDEEAVFYLKARGLKEDSAREMLVGAFLGEVYEKVEIDAVRAWLEGM